MSKRIATSNVCPTALGTGLLALDVVYRLDSNDIPPAMLAVLAGMCSQFSVTWVGTRCRSAA